LTLKPTRPAAPRADLRSEDELSLELA